MSTEVDPSLFNQQAFCQSLANCDNPLPLFRNALNTAADILKERFLSGRSATELVHARAKLIDALIVQAWLRFFTKDDANIALLATGGYGRGELHPASDIDVLILLRKHNKNYHSPIESFLTFIWDIGLEIGQSTRTPKECAKEAKKDITIATNLQESRLLYGPEDLVETQRRLCAPKKVWSGRDFFTAKLQEQTRRHLKFNDTAYNLEPNVKEGPGGLRDIQMIGWVAKRHFGADTLHQLVEHKFLTEEEYQILHEGQAFLWQIRFGLHVITGRREDRLLFEHQRTLASQFGYRDNSKHLAVEQFMKQYYRTIMELSRLNEMLLQLFQEELLLKHDSKKPVTINNRFQARKGFLEVKNPQVFKRYPFALLEIFLILQQHPELKGVRAHTIRLIRDHRYLIDENFRADLRCRSLFMEILRSPVGITHELRRMNLYGILAAYLPIFRQITGQMQHDLFHVYTVDEHTLFVIRNLRRFTVEEFKHEFPLCSKLIHRLPKQELVLIAALFHDIAKGRGGDHSVLGVQDAIDFCKHHGLSSFDTNLVAWLIKNHLLMSTTAQRMDISDPEVVHNFARLVGDKEHLNYLYLLTVADIRGTSFKVWNSWKDALLKTLYHATRYALRRGLENPVIKSEHIEEIQSQSRQQLLKLGLNDKVIDDAWRRLGDEYFLRYTTDEIVWHMQAILSNQSNDLPLILLQQKPQQGGTDLFIYAEDYLGLFAIITSVLAQMNLNIMDARIVNSQDGHSLDTFLILEPEGGLLTDTHRTQDLTEKLKRYLTLPDSPRIDVPQHLPRQVKHFKFPTKVLFQEDKNKNRTIMEIVAYDRPGLLSHIGAALHACNMRLQNAKIATYGERAEDIFFITDVDRQPLTQQTQFDCLRDAITEALDT